MAIALSFADYLENNDSQQTQAALAVLGDVGYQLYVTDGETVERCGGESTELSRLINDIQ